MSSSLNEITKKCHLLEELNLKNEAMKQKYTLLKRRNEDITNSLMKIKRDNEMLKSQLQRELICVRIRADKQRLLLQKRLDSFYKNQKTLELKNQQLPLVSKLDNLIKGNKLLFEEFTQVVTMIECAGKETPQQQQQQQQQEQQKNLQNSQTNNLDGS